MRRAAAAIAGTIVVLWLILSFKSSPTSRVASSPNASNTNTTAPTTTVPASPSDSGSQPPAGPPPPSGTRTVNGTVISTQFGDVQVAVVLNGTQIVDVKPLQLPYDRPRSQYISEQAAPLLHDEVLQAQSAQIDTIGGATYTSDAYAQSLQSALDKAKA
jgi:FMN-binding protein